MVTIGVLVVIIAGILVYYTTTVNSQVNSGNSTISTLQNEVRTQQSVISSLDNQLAQPGGVLGNVSITGIDPVRI